MREERTILVIAGGDPVTPDELGPVPSDAFVIAADSGIDRALELSLHVDLAVGDFDSVTPHALDEVARAGAVIEAHPEAKDRTDLELALDAALDRQPARVIVVGGHGGRLDHFLANALLLASPGYAPLDIVAHMGPARVTVVRDVAALHGEPGDLVTLVPVNGPATGVTTEGLLYPLHGEALQPGSTRGVSNELAEPVASVRLTSGVLLAVQAGECGTHWNRARSTAP
ncbi:MAG: thiamine pyrophosphokinae [Nocardioidaceae bacterium]|nr:thiamine pyrophosphokinae [Nocardioidaceae bacterium]